MLEGDAALFAGVHSVVDTSGQPVRLALTAGEAHDNRLVLTLPFGLKSGRNIAR
jgi:hypothetical protein